MPAVVITGLGVLCASGNSRDEFADALRSGRSGLGPLERFEPDWFVTQVSAEIRHASYDHVMPPAEQKHIDLNSLMTLAAADEAVRQAGFEAEGDGHRTGVFLGTGMGSGVDWEEAFHDVTLKKRKPRPTTVPKCMYNAPAGHLSIRYGLRGPSHVTVTACSSSAQALGQALVMIRAGICDSALVGGVESMPGFEMWAAWDTLRVMSRDNDHPERSCRPFSQDREGFVMGEAVSILVLETEARAKARGANILAELAGVGFSSDAHHITRPQVDGMTAAMRAAMDDAGLAPGDVDYVNAHGTGTPANDPIETEAIKKVFGDDAGRVAVSSTKSTHGHTIGAAGALEAAATVLAIEGGFAPPTLHLDEPDPDCDLDYVPNQARELTIDAALSNSFAFGGHNAVLAFRRYRG